jgi:acyl carrier protein
VDDMTRLKLLLAEALGDESLADGISDDADIVNDIGIDSIQMITFLLNVEDDFGVNLDFENLDLSDLTSLRKFHAFVTSTPATAA